MSVSHTTFSKPHTLSHTLTHALNASKNALNIKYDSKEKKQIHEWELKALQLVSTHMQEHRKTLDKLFNEEQISYKELSLLIISLTPVKIISQGKVTKEGHALLYKFHFFEDPQLSSNQIIKHSRIYSDERTFEHRSDFCFRLPDTTKRWFKDIIMPGGSKVPFRYMRYSAPTIKINSSCSFPTWHDDFSLWQISESSSVESSVEEKDRYFRFDDNLRQDVTKIAISKDELNLCRAGFIRAGITPARLDSVNCVLAPGLLLSELSVNARTSDSVEEFEKSQSKEFEMLRSEGFEKFPKEYLSPIDFIEELPKNKPLDKKAYWNETLPLNRKLHWNDKLPPKSPRPSLPSEQSEQGSSEPQSPRTSEPSQHQTNWNKILISYEIDPMIPTRQQNITPTKQQKFLLSKQSHLEICAEAIKSLYDDYGNHHTGNFQDSCRVMYSSFTLQNS